MRHLVSVTLLALLLLVAACSIGNAISYDPNTTIVVLIHGFDPDGWTYTNVTYGDDFPDDVDTVAAYLGQPAYWTDPTAPNQVCATEYYGDTAPTWYTADDLAQVNAMPSGVPRYAMRCAKYIQHVLGRAPTATAVNVYGISFGGEISRYMIEHDLLGLASSQKISRWLTLVGVVTGNWAASSSLANVAPFFDGGDSPDIPQMDKDWVDANISAHDTMNTALYGPMVIMSTISDDDGDGYITALCNDPNDDTNNCDDEFFHGYTVSAARHAATDGTLQMPMFLHSPTTHTGTADNPGVWASAAAFSKGNVRVTMTLTRTKALKGDQLLYGRGEWVWNFAATSPMANTLWGVTSPLTDIRYENGTAPLVTLNKNETKYPNVVLFDQIIPPGETMMTVSIHPYELDWCNKFYDLYEIGGASDMGTVTMNIYGNGVTRFLNGNFDCDITTAVRTVY